MQHKKTVKKYDATYHEGKWGFNGFLPGGAAAKSGQMTRALFDPVLIATPELLPGFGPANGGT